MRRAINENPIAQVAVIGVLAIAVGFMLLTRLSGGPEPPPPAAETAPAPTEAGSGSVITPAPPAAATEPATGSAAPEAAAGVGEFEAGPGLPAPVVQAHEDGRAVVLLFTRQGGTEDRPLERTLARLRGVERTSVFHAHARSIARYSRVAGGVDVSRVPALVVVHPPRRDVDGVPVATVSYGFRGPASAEQAVRDALYQGRRNMPYHPYPDSG